MKTVKWTFLISALVLTLASCSYPDYQLSFDITQVQVDGVNDQVRVYYTLSNNGFEDLENVTLRIETYAGANAPVSAWTNPINLPSGTYTGVNILLVNFPKVLDGTETPSATVTATAWDTDD